MTGEAVALDLRPAALPSRLLAGTLDASLQLVLFFLLLALESAIAPSVSSAATLMWSWSGRSRKCGPGNWTTNAR